MEFLAVILILVVAAAWVMLSSRLLEVERRLQAEAADRRLQGNLIAQLTQRMNLLESAAPVVATPLPSAPVEAPHETPAPPPLPSPTARRVCQFCGRTVPLSAATCSCGAVMAPSRSAAPVGEPEKPPPLPEPAISLVPVMAVPVPMPVAEPAPAAVAPESWRDLLRKKIGDQEWEAIVGGSWLNKLGVLVLVIGIALLLGYEFTRVGPAGRVAIGMSVSLAMLISGVVVERRPLYAIFARGLIGGGWAALYFTTYAMHAIPAAKVIESPYLGTSLLLIVALGMILHSLRYRSQTVSGLAYFIGFATLALGENTPFSVLAMLPLAASLLFLAYRFDWYKMAVSGWQPLI